MTRFRPRPHVSWVAAGTVLLGTVLMVAGTFAPWLQSGRSRRNVYQAAGVLHRLLDLPGPGDAALDVLPWLGLYCALCGLLLAAGQPRAAGIALFVAAVLVAVICVAALVAPSSSGVRAVAVGPIISGVGAGTVMVMIFRLARRR